MIFIYLFAFFAKWGVDPAAAVAQDKANSFKFWWKLGYGRVDLSAAAAANSAEGGRPLAAAVGFLGSNPVPTLYIGFLEDARGYHWHLTR